MTVQSSERIFARSICLKALSRLLVSLLNNSSADQPRD
jgi:hypothetical protein